MFRKTCSIIAGSSFFGKGELFRNRRSPARPRRALRRTPLPRWLRELADEFKALGNDFKQALERAVAAAQECLALKSDWRGAKAHREVCALDVFTKYITPSPGALRQPCQIGRQRPFYAKLHFIL